MDISDSYLKNAPKVQSLAVIVSPNIVKGDIFTNVDIDMMFLKRITKVKLKADFDFNKDKAGVRDLQQQLLRLLEGKG